MIEPSVTVPDRVDLAFPLAGAFVPRDHGYALFGALSRVVGGLHSAPWLAVHPIDGVPTPDGLPALGARRGSLRLRVAPAEIARVLALSGKVLDIDGRRVPDMQRRFSRPLSGGACGQ